MSAEAFNRDVWDSKRLSRFFGWLGTQGLGLALAPPQLRWLAHAHERRKGGDPKQLPVAIVEHADVQRMFNRMIARVEVLHGLAFATANQIDFSVHRPRGAGRSVHVTGFRILAPALN